MFLVSWQMYTRVTNLNVPGNSKIDYVKRHMHTTKPFSGHSEDNFAPFDSMHVQDKKEVQHSAKKGKPD